MNPRRRNLKLMKIEKLKSGLKNSSINYTSIANNLGDTIEKLKDAEGFEDGDRLRMMLNETTKDVEILIDLVDSLSKNFNGNVQSSIIRVQEFFGNIPSEETSSSVIRNIAQANGEIERISMGTRDSVKILKELGEPLTKLLRSMKELKELMEREE